MKTNKVTLGQKTVVKIDHSLSKFKDMNLFEKKTAESAAVLLRAKLTFR